MADTRERLQGGMTAPARSADDDPADAPWGIMDILTAVLVTFGVLAVIILASSLLLHVLNVPADKPEEDPIGAVVALLSQAVIDLAAVASAALWSIRKYRLSPRAWGLRRTRPLALRWCGLVLFCSFAALTVYGVITRVLGLDELEPKSNIPDALFQQRAVVPFTLLLVVVVAPLTEEMFFRGFVFNGLRRRFGVVGAAIVSGSLFSVIHFSGIGQLGILIPFAIIGFLFAMLVARTGSLWNSILVHFLFNLFSSLGAILGTDAGVLIGLASVIAVFIVLSQVVPMFEGIASEGGPAA